jgi:hypothetical protein
MGAIKRLMLYMVEQSGEIGAGKITFHWGKTKEKQST